MAIYFLNMKSFGRAGGSSAVSAAAYRSGERLHDERTGRTYDHSERHDVLHKEIMLPSHLIDTDMSWAKDRANLWNSAEHAEVRQNARVAREYLVALPVELAPEQRVNLARGFARELTDRYRFALDLTVHAPRDFPGSDPRNFHAHLLATTREVTPRGLAAKTTLELNNSARQERGLESTFKELVLVRGRWASVTNEALREAHLDVRIDHRSLAAQGIDREPYPHIPRAAFELERRGTRSVEGERLRAQYRDAVQWRKDRGAAVQPQSAEAAPGSEQRTRPTAGDIAQQAVERWLKYRETARAADSPTAEQAAERWLKYREAARAAETPTAKQSREAESYFRENATVAGKSVDSQTAGRSHDRDRDNDFSL